MPRDCLSGPEEAIDVWPWGACACQENVYAMWPWGSLLAARWV